MFLLGIGRLLDEFYLKKKLTAEFYVINFLLSGGNKKEAPLVFGASLVFRLQLYDQSGLSTVCFRAAGCGAAILAFAAARRAIGTRNGEQLT